MKKISYLLFSVSLPFLLHSCKEVKEEYYPNGHLKSRIEYRSGKEHGKIIFYDEGYGTPNLVMTMKNGKKHGQLTRYFFNGNIETSAYYNNDIQEGVESIYDLKGNKIMESHYERGLRHGPYTSWHEKNMIREKGAFKNDKFDGEWVYYDERGLLVGEGNFTEGTGTQTAYDQNGNIMRVTHYVNNMKNGDEIHFHSNGDTLKVVTYLDDRISKIDNEEVSITDEE